MIIQDVNLYWFYFVQLYSWYTKCININTKTEGLVKIFEI